MLSNLMKFATRSRLGIGLISSAAVLCGSLPTTAQAIPFSSISQVYFFGDSLTDSGFNNLFPGRPANKAPTFTTLGGYTWSQYVAHDVKGFPLPTYPAGQADLITNNTTPTQGPGFVLPILTGVDYAAGGSTTNSLGNVLTYAPSLVQQVNHYLATAPQTLDPNAVYFIWSGANDILTLLNPAHLPTELQLLMAAHNAAVNIANEASALSARGAKRIVVLSLPNIGLTPAITGLASQIPTLPGQLQTVTFTFNSMLNQELGRVLQQQRNDTKILYFDVYTLFNQVIAATINGQPFVVGGASFKFTNFTNEACGPGVSAILCTQTGGGDIFADSVHPTDMAHRALSIAVEQALANWH